MSVATISDCLPASRRTSPWHAEGAFVPCKGMLGFFDVPADVAAQVRQMHDLGSLDDAKTSAHREIEVLSHAYTKAVECGYLDQPRCKGEVRLTGEKPRTRYVEDWEIVECLSIEARRKAGSVLAIPAYMRIKLLTGMRRGDLLRLGPSNLQDDGIHVMPGKTEGSTAKQIIDEWSDALREAVAMAMAARPVQIVPWLFCTPRGECYFNETTGRAGGWDTMWRNIMTPVLEETKLKEDFTEHDLRAKCASDAETLEHAQALMAHADGKVTKRIYRRKPERVKPLR
jgi:integrase